MCREDSAVFFQYFCKDAEKVCRKLELAERLAGDLFLVLQIDLGVGWKIQIVLFYWKRSPGGLRGLLRIYYYNFIMIIRHYLYTDY